MEHSDFICSLKLGRINICNHESSHQPTLSHKHSSAIPYRNAETCDSALKLVTRLEALKLFQASAV
jgi:hypothetical protein